MKMNKKAQGLSMETVGKILLVLLVVAIVVAIFLRYSDNFESAGGSASDLFWNSSLTPDKPEEENGESSDSGDESSQDSTSSSNDTIQIRLGANPKEVREGNTLNFTVGSTYTLSVWGTGDKAYSCSISVLDESQNIVENSNLFWHQSNSRCSMNSADLDDFISQGNVLSKNFNPGRGDEGIYQLIVSLRDKEGNRTQSTHINLQVISRASSLDEVEFSIWNNDRSENLYGRESYFASSNLNINLSLNKDYILEFEVYGGDASVCVYNLSSSSEGNGDLIANKIEACGLFISDLIPVDFPDSVDVSQEDALYFDLAAKDENSVSLANIRVRLNVFDSSYLPPKLEVS